MKADLEYTVSQQILEKAGIHTEWVNSVVLVEKGNGICLDAKDLNRVIKCDFHKCLSPTTAGAIMFSKVDASAEKRHKEHDKDSAYSLLALMCLNTLLGSFHFSSLLFRTHSTIEMLRKGIS